MPVATTPPPRSEEDAAPADGDITTRWGRVFGVIRWAVLAAVLFLLAGNLIILGASMWARESTARPTGATVPGVPKLRVVDGRVWRGAAPADDGYRALAAAGVRTIVDLRAEDVDVDERRLAVLGLDLVRLPVRDGQTPTTPQVDRFLEAVRRSDGVTFVHCGAGVGRTGAMAAAYRVTMGEATGLEAMRANLSVGPPSLEQLAYAASIDQDDDPARPSPGVVALSRVLDAPRRLWHVVGL